VGFARTYAYEVSPTQGSSFRAFSSQWAAYTLRPLEHERLLTNVDKSITLKS
jgi:hypothetical protein